MKKQTELLLGLFFMALLFGACQKNKPIENPIPVNKELRFARDLARQLGINTELKDVSMQTSAPTSRLQQSETAFLELSQAVKISFTLSNGEVLTTTSIPYSNKANTYLEYIEYRGTVQSLVIETSFDPQNKIFRAKLASGNQRFSIGGWFDCMKGVLGSDVGVVIGVGSVLPGVGQAVAGFFMGVSALGCMGAA
jgi:hypothetical protein